MQLVGCYKKAKRRKAWHFQSHNSVQNFDKHIPSKIFRLSNLHPNKTRNLSLVVGDKDKLHLLLPEQAYNPSFLCFVSFNCLKHCPYKKNPHFYKLRLYCYFTLWNLAPRELQLWLVHGQQFYHFEDVSLVGTGWYVSPETHSDWRRGTNTLK